MSDTPRTDAATRHTRTHGDPLGAGVVYRSFAERLERELTAAQAEALKLQEENAKLRRALERLVEAPDNRSLEDFTPEELEAWANAKAVLENTQ